MTPTRQRSTLFQPLACIVTAMAMILPTFFTANSAMAQPDDQSIDEPRGGPARGEGDRPRSGWRGERRGRMWKDRPGKPDRPVPEEMIEEIMSFVEEKLPERFDRLVQLRERNPERFNHLMQRMAPVAMEYLRLRERSPEMAENIIRDFKSQERLHELARLYKEAEGDEAKQAELEQEIAEVVRSQEDFVQQMTEHRLAEFEERLRRQTRWVEAQRERLEQEKANSDERVAKRVERIKEGDVRPPFMPIGRFGPGGPDGSGGPRHDGPRDGSKRWRRGGPSPEDHDRRPHRDPPEEPEDN